MLVSAASELDFRTMRTTINRSRRRVSQLALGERKVFKDWQRRGYACQMHDEYGTKGFNDRVPLVPVGV